VSEYFVERKKLIIDSDHDVVLTGKLHSVYGQLMCKCKHVQIRCGKTYWI